jgi:hypothetical protein
MRDRLQDRVNTYGLLEELDSEHFFAKLKPALRDIAAHDPASDDVPHRWQEALDERDPDS